MLNEKKIKELVLVSLVADAYCLGAHWVYDEKQLQNASFDWNILNTPLSIWHKGKTAGEFTHYGDQTYWLYKFLENKDDFKAEEFLIYWNNKMKTYEGYIDGASRQTIKNIEEGVSPSGSNSADLSIVGRIAPLLKVSKTKAEFLKNVDSFVRLTHDSPKALNASRFFAKVIWNLIEGKELSVSIESIKDEFDTKIQAHINKAIASKEADTFETIRNFGPACDVDDGFAGALHLLAKYDNLKEMLIENAKAGGDSSARAMIASIIFMMNRPASQIPQNWLSIKVTI
jgi:ADP-ribosylglycohydrolase